MYNNSEYEKSLSQLSEALLERLRGNTSAAAARERAVSELFEPVEMGRHYMNVATKLAANAQFIPAMEMLEQADFCLTYSPTREIELFIANATVQWYKGGEGLIDALHALQLAGLLLERLQTAGTPIESGIVEGYNNQLGVVLTTILRSAKQGSPLTAFAAIYRLPSL